jgi:sigma-E factor negative regulatory protein RseC
VENDLKAQVGDHVEISVPARSLVKLSIVVYLIPILALVAGAILGSVWAEARGAEPSVPSILGGAVAMGAALYVVKKFDRSIQSKRQYQPRLTKILPQKASPDLTP